MKNTLFILLFLITAATGVSADPKAPEEDLIARYLFPPEVVMRYQQQIGLQENQSAEIKNEIQKTQSGFIDLQWQMQAEAQKMTALLQENPVDESKVLSQADKVMNLERQIKKTHLTLLVRIKNLLTEEQKNRLMELRKNEPR
ncbi:periplasmic heavy metal sensor [bacterium]|nr:periplasmic heavy metal sensor [bacterium]